MGWDQVPIQAEKLPPIFGRRLGIITRESGSPRFPSPPFYSEGSHLAIIDSVTSSPVAGTQRIEFVLALLGMPSAHAMSTGMG